MNKKQKYTRKKQATNEVASTRNKQETATNGVASTIISGIAQGFTFGLGSSLAHTGIDKIFNKPEVDIEKDVNINQSNCDHFIKAYTECISNEQINCNELIELYKICNTT